MERKEEGLLVLSEESDDSNEEPFTISTSNNTSTEAKASSF
jgi:hypothetical protein